MTKTIEYIDLLIKEHKILKGDNQLFEDGYIEECIQTLEQIKCELEAWEVVKRELKLVVKDDKHKYDFVYYWLLYHPYELLEIEKKDYEILKKVLEV